MATIDTSSLETEDSHTKDNLLVESISDKNTKMWYSILECLQAQKFTIITLMGFILIIVLCCLFRIVLLFISCSLLICTVILMIKRCYDQYQRYSEEFKNSSMMLDQLSSPQQSEIQIEDLEIEEDSGIGERNLNMLENPAVMTPSHSILTINDLMDAINRSHFLMNNLRAQELLSQRESVQTSNNRIPSPTRRRRRTRGISQENLDKLPSFKFENKNSLGDDECLCSICYGEYTEGETIRTLPCIHNFHLDCVDEWLKRKATCPLCKGKVQFR